MLKLIFSTLVSNRTVGKIYGASLVSFIFLISNYSIALATDKEKVYKVRLNTNPSVGSVDIWNLNGREASEEWIVIKVTGNKQFKIYHSTYLVNKTWKTRQWFDHPVTAMKICLTDGFEKKDCKVVNSDTATIPEGASLHNLSIDFKYSESGRSFSRSIEIAKDIKPE